MRTKVKNISLKDIADRAGVSSALVSFVLNGKSKEYRVGEDTAKHILKIAKEMNYRPNNAARSLRSGKTFTIGVVLSDISNPFFAQIARNVEDEAGKRGYTVFFGSSDEDSKKMQRVVDSLINQGIDGLIIVPSVGSKDFMYSLQTHQESVVLLDRQIPELHMSYVGLNNFNAGYNATRHLLDSGYSFPGMVAYDTDLSHMNERIRGYKQAMADAGLRPNIGFIKPNSPLISAEKVLVRMIDGGVDALFFATNTISIASLHIVNKMKLRVPHDLGLVGFDGSEAFDFFYAPVSYIKQPIDLLAQKAIEILLDIISSDNISIQSVSIEGELVVRQSSVR